MLRDAPQVLMLEVRKIIEHKESSGGGAKKHRTKAEPSRAEHSRAEQSRAEQRRAEQSRAEQAICYAMLCCTKDTRVLSLTALIMRLTNAGRFARPLIA
jgi:hypothetical protein